MIGIQKYKVAELKGKKDTISRTLGFAIYTAKCTATIFSFLCQEVNYTCFLDAWYAVTM